MLGACAKAESGIYLGSGVSLGADVRVETLVGPEICCGLVGRLVWFWCERSRRDAVQAGVRLIVSIRPLGAALRTGV